MLIVIRRVPRGRVLLLGGDVGGTNLGLRDTCLAKRSKWTSHGLTGTEIDVRTQMVANTMLVALAGGPFSCKCDSFLKISRR
jgi:hypothetical protein